MRQKSEHGSETDTDLKEWGRLLEREAVPDRLRDLAARLCEALTAARSNRPPPRDH